MTNRKRIENLINRLRLAIAGVQKHFANDPTIVIDGVPTKPADFIASLTGVVNAIDEATAAERTFHEAVAAEKAALATGRTALANLEALCVHEFGKKGAALGDFGFDQTTPRTPDVATKEQAVKKREATRAARGTKGPRAKLAIKGELPATPVIPPAKS